MAFNDADPANTTVFDAEKYRPVLVNWVFEGQTQHRKNYSSCFSSDGRLWAVVQVNKIVLFDARKM